MYTAQANKRKNHKLYNALRKHDDFIVEILVESSVQYCSELEFKLRSKPNIGLNHAIGGIDSFSKRLNWIYSEEAKLKVKEGCVNRGKLSDATKHKMRLAAKTQNRSKWNNNLTNIDVWKNADFYYLKYLEMLELCKDSHRKFSPKVFEEISGLKIASSHAILQSFRKNWVPMLDIQWKKHFKIEGNIS